MWSYYIDNNADCSMRRPKGLALRRILAIAYKHSSFRTLSFRLMFVYPANKHASLLASNLDACLLAGIIISWKYNHPQYFSHNKGPPPNISGQPLTVIYPTVRCGNQHQIQFLLYRNTGSPFYDIISLLGIIFLKSTEGNCPKIAGAFIKCTIVGIIHAFYILLILRISIVSC